MALVVGSARVQQQSESSSSSSKSGQMIKACADGTCNKQQFTGTQTKLTTSACLPQVRHHQREQREFSSQQQVAVGSCRDPCCCCCSYYHLEASRDKPTATTTNMTAKLQLNSNSQENQPPRDDCKMIIQQQQQSSSRQAINVNKQVKKNNKQKNNYQHDRQQQCSGSSDQKQVQQEQHPVEDDSCASCAKCQLIARWTSAQAAAQLAKVKGDSSQQPSRQQQQQVRRSTDLTRPKSLQMPALISGGQLAQVRRSELSTCLPNGLTAKGDRHKYAVCPLRADNLQQQQQQQACEDLKSSLKQDYVEFNANRCQVRKQEAEEDEAEISSLTDSSLDGLSGRREDDDDDDLDRNGDDDDDEDVWSLSSCYQATRRHRRGVPIPQKSAAVYASRLPSLRRRRIAVKLTPLGGGVQRKRRPAPLPPTLSDGIRPVRQFNGGKRQQMVASITNHNRPECANSLDSGNTSGADTSRHSSGTEDAVENGGKTQQQIRPNLLSESEVYSIEHFLKSHKSSIYVCGCMANLYLTSTLLVDNGRCSKPATEGWQLSKTGVPVLTFDSGLTRNRDKRRLSINLTERGSGFVLWSDIIDHLSNYRAYCARIHDSGLSAITSTSPKSSSVNADKEQTCDTFHVMYLSTNHRVMVGLSFDDPTCARLFLKQVELITSDPANISLTGPKLAHRLASVSRLGRLLRGGQQQKQQVAAKRTKSIGSITTSTTLAAQQQSQNERKHIWASTTCMLAEHTDSPANIQAAPQKQRRSNRLTRLISAGGRLSAPATGASRSMNHNPTAADYTWSTLRRAIKFGQQSSRLSHHLSATSFDPLTAGDERGVASAFRPKPLASLAMAGKVYRAGKRMPQKCDISAPCLFQHVTRVDQSGLNQLYSKSLLVSSGTGSESAKLEQGESDAANNIENLHLKKAASGSVASSDRLCSKLSMISASETKDQSHSVEASSVAGASTSTFSCYSSGASISPASSEYGVAAHQAHQASQEPSKQQQQHYAAARHAYPARRDRTQRPLPPKVPQRGTSSAAAAATVTVASDSGGVQFERAGKQTTAIATQVQAANNKIQAIIRELQAQTSSELVDAKRKLMADIADQVVVRAAAAEQAAAAAATTNGSVSRL